jgi:YHS domain-containing protein
MIFSWNLLSIKRLQISLSVIRLPLLALLMGIISHGAMAQVPTKSTDGQFNNNLDANGCMLQGFDVVAMLNQPDQTLKGTKDYESQFQGGKYWFISAANKAAFDANPSKYAPLFGGYCALAVSEGNLRPVQVWTHEIVDGHLVVNHNAKAKKLWDHRSSHKLKKALNKWPAVNQKPAAYDILHGNETQASLSATSFAGPPVK